jgi:cell division protein FtsB
MSKDPINFLFQEQTYKVVANPTNEDFDMQYAGVSFTIKSGEEKTMAINAANHILNSFGPRGLVWVMPDADKEKIFEAGRRINKEFKHRQVTEFNVRNENRKHMKMGSLTPSDKIKEYAAELGLKLEDSYAQVDQQISGSKAQDEKIASLEATIANLTKLVDTLVRGREEQKPEEEEKRKPGNPNWNKVVK